MEVSSTVNSAKKVLALPHTIPIYYYAGHGEDVCDSNSHKPIVRKVPDNCIYITIVECGQYADIDLVENPREKLFRSQDPAIQQLLRFPYYKKNKQELARLFEVSDPQTIHIHFPGMDYVESFFQPIAYWDDNPELWNEGQKPLLVFARSGLLDKAKMSPQQRKEVTAEGVENFYITKNEVIKFYEESIYPTPDVVQTILDEEAFKDKYILDADDIQVFITNLVNTMEAGVNSELPYSKLSNTYMMEKFPGIHYNVICRAVSEECMPEAELYRIQSTTQETARQHANIEKLITNQLILPKLLPQKTRRNKRNQKTKKNKNKNKSKY